MGALQAPALPLGDATDDQAESMRKAGICGQPEFIFNAYKILDGMVIPKNGNIAYYSDIEGNMGEKAAEANWTVTYSRKASKQLKDMPEKIRAKMALLAREISENGPIRKNWHNFGALKGPGLPLNTYHCHLKKGAPTYVTCWYILHKELKKVEVFYVGTHENAPY